MFKYMLIRKIYDGDQYYDPEVIGIFDSIAIVNKYLQTSDDYPDHIKFISCRQLIEYPFQDTHYQLDLTSVPHNPVNKINELKQFFEEEPTILDLEEEASVGKSNLLEHKKKGYSIHTYFSDDSLSLQLWGWAIVLKEDGRWFWEDTSGG